MDRRFVQDRGLQVYTGTELLLKGALEGQVSLITGYPGSPIADFFNSARHIKDLLDEKGIVVQVANNEALSAARLNGSQMEDIKAIAAMKSVGAHVASDGLALGNLSKFAHKGGALVVIGDDPWSESTQVPSDSRFLSKHLHMPVMEPATFQELKDWVPVGLDLSQKSDLFVTYLVTTNLADGGGTVNVYSNQTPTISAKRPVEIETAEIPVDQTVILSPRTAIKEETLSDRFDDLIRFSRLHEVNQILYANPNASIGFITSGMAYSYLEHAFCEMGLEGQFPILKFGITYPLDEDLLLEFSKPLDHVFVIEERRDFLESQVVLVLKNAYQSGKLKREISVWGKQFPGGLTAIPSTRGLNPSILIELLAPVFLKLEALPQETKHRIHREVALVQETLNRRLTVPSRTPTFCPGCPHRDSSSVFLEVKKKFRDSLYMRRRHHREPVDLLFHGDTGCYTMLMFEPNKDLMHNYSGMGLGGGTGAGINPFITNKQVVFMGDSTFFHSGMIAISDAIKHGQDITFVILDNGTTAMTGHQPTPSQDFDIVGNLTATQDIEEIVRGMAKGLEIPVHRTNPGYRNQYLDLIEETVLKDGVKVVIADKECGITHDRRISRQERRTLKEKGFLAEKRVINITPEVCEFCLECTTATGCPGLTITQTIDGPKLLTDLSWCKSDGACTKLSVCPAFEEMIIRREKPSVIPSFDSDIQFLTQPEREDFSESWGVYIAGVGGMGIGVVTAILVQAGMRQGYQVQFVDKKGLAIRNGGVYSHVIYSKNGKMKSPITPYGKANLLIGLDILEAARSIDPKVNLRVASKQQTSSVVNTHKTPTVAMLLGRDHFNAHELEEAIRIASRPGRYFGGDLSEVAEIYLGSKVFMNILMLGYSYQKGFLPIGLDELTWAIQKSVPADASDENMKAFNLGRLCAMNPSKYFPSYHETFESVVSDKEAVLRKRFWQGPRLARAYRNLAIRASASLRMDDKFNQEFAHRIYELIEFEKIDTARTYVELVKAVKHKDLAERHFEATRIAALCLPKVMAIKDEVYVAHLLTSEEKLKRDRLRYRIDPTRGDRVSYRHLTRPEFSIFGIRFRFSLVARNWQLQLMKHMKFLRQIMPSWHRKEKMFRDWYVGLVRQFHFSDTASYERYIEALRTCEDVRGFREIRYPKMSEARRKAERLLRKASSRNNLYKLNSPRIPPSH